MQYTDYQQIPNGNRSRTVYDQAVETGDSGHRCGKIVAAGYVHKSLTPYYTNPDNVQQCGNFRKFVHPDMAYFAERG